MQLTILHTNDIHGQVDGLARIATLVERIREETPHRVIYVDAGDVEETTTRLSNLTKGVAMHRLLSAAGCEAAAVGNATWLRYGPQVIGDQARAASYPLLLANLAPVEGVQPAAMIDGIGFVGVTDPFYSFLRTGVYGIEATDEVEQVRHHARALRAQGAELVICLSHLGYDFERETPHTLDVALARQVEGDVDVIIGAHTHHLLPEGHRVGSVLIVQAGSLASHLGRIDIDGDQARASVIEVTDDVPKHAAVVAAAAAAEHNLDESLDEVIADLDAPLDGAWMAEMLRERMSAEIGIVTDAVVLDEPLPAGPLRRGALWEVCHSTANPAVTELTGERLAHMIERANDPEFVQTTTQSLRGRPRGPLHVAGQVDIDPAQTYRVAATDFELEDYGGLVEPGWGLAIRYDFPTIIREATEERLRAQATGDER